MLCAAGNGMATRTPLDAFVYYGNAPANGGPALFPTNSVRLPTFLSHAVARVDLDGDGWDDLVFTQSGKPMLVYWNSDHGFDPCKRNELPIIASYVTAADIDGDHRLDLVAITSSGIEVYHNNGHGIDSNMLVCLAVKNASRCAAVDLNADGRPDIVVAVDAVNSNSLVFWNDGKQFSSAKPTELPTTRAGPSGARRPSR